MDNLRGLDIQLLLAFDALMADPHVTRAARVIGVSQPAMSHILARLRELFGDPLLVRTSRGMSPTARALELITPVRSALRELRSILGAPTAFEPATSCDTFTIRMGDVNESLILPALLKVIEKEAPKVSLKVLHLPVSETLKALDAQEIDFAISAGLSHPVSIRSTPVLEDEMICIMRKGHPAEHRPLTQKAFLALRYINIAQSIFDEQLSKQNLRRDVLLSVPQWLVAPFIVESTNLVTVISRRMASLFNVRKTLALRPLQFGSQLFQWRMYWHQRHDAHPGQKWAREAVIRACTGL